MSRFNLDDYEPVEVRLERFWADHRDCGRIITELIRAEGDVVIFRAEAYREEDDTRPAATGYAQEVVGSSPVNKTSALENCETSAIGRALANMGYAPKGSRPSREEMAKSASPAPPTEREKTAPNQTQGKSAGSGAVSLLLDTAKKAGVTKAALTKRAHDAWSVSSLDDCTDQQLAFLTEELTKAAS